VSRPLSGAATRVYILQALAAGSADRWELLDARADSVRSERARRISETREKYQASHEVRPYRLHIYEVPVWRLPVDVRRGDRRYPLTLDWLIPLTRFADVACPRCGADQRLVATKTGLGCTGCVPRRTVQLAPEPTRPPAKPAAKAKQVVTQPPTPRQRPSPVRTDPSRTPATLEKLGDKLTRKVWDAVVCNDRRLARLCSHALRQPHSHPVGNGYQRSHPCCRRTRSRNVMG